MAYQTQTASRHALLGAVRDIYFEGNDVLVPSQKATGSIALQRSSTLFTTFPVSKFYRGFSVTLLGMVPYAGTSFLVWGALRAALLPPPPQSQTSSTPTAPRHRPLADLSIGAVSGAIAQTVSYPFEIVRRRLQVGGLIRPRCGSLWPSVAGARGSVCRIRQSSESRPECRIRSRWISMILKGGVVVVGNGLCGERRCIFDMMMNTVHRLVITSSILSFSFLFSFHFSSSFRLVVCMHIVDDVSSLFHTLLLDRVILDIACAFWQASGAIYIVAFA